MIDNSIVQFYLSQNSLVGETLIDYSLRNDGDGVYIDFWNTDKLGIQPTNETLESMYDLMLLTNAKNAKFEELKAMYDVNNYNSAIWSEIMVKFVGDTKATLTKSHGWFLLHMSTFINSKVPIYLKDDQDNIVTVNLTTGQGQQISASVLQIGLLISFKKDEIVALINNSTTVDAINAIDIIQEFSTVNREIVIQDV